MEVVEVRKKLKDPLVQGMITWYPEQEIDRVLMALGNLKEASWIRVDVKELKRIQKEIMRWS
jgi:hypothetical protein